MDINKGHKGHKYYTQAISQIQLSQSNQGYFIVWTTKDSFIEIVGKNEAFWVSINLGFFFKRFVATRLLAINPLKRCSTCQKVLLEKLEISSKETNMRSICCDQCRIWYHCECEKVFEISDKYINWLCFNCLSKSPITSMMSLIMYKHL